MRSVRNEIVLVCLLLSGASLSPADADGLVYQLPNDGTWAVYTVRGATNAGAGDWGMNGTLRIASVGRVVVAGLPCRWIETRLDLAVTRGDQSTPIRHLYRVLIPERHLTRGESPLDHVVCAVGQWGDSDPVESKSLDELGSTAWLRVVLSGPWRTVKQLDCVDICGKLGTLSCLGEEGSLDVLNEVRTTTNWQLRNRLHCSSPFGVVTADWKMRHGDTFREEWNLDLTDFGDNEGTAEDIGRPCASETERRESRSTQCQEAERGPKKIRSLFHRFPRCLLRQTWRIGCAPRPGNTQVQLDTSVCAQTRYRRLQVPYPLIGYRVALNLEMVQ